MNLNVLAAIFKRNFISYFSSPTGYVFICVFVVLSSLATFWPADFFNDNLANLNQLNKYLPFILLIFVPAITMSLWAEERRQGTDELLLTIPASDLDVVLGKYLASVAIYTVALLFSAASIYLVFRYGLGTPDGGLYIASFIGYWFAGVAMLGIGMIASFLTNNLTIAFILGVIFNAPLAIAGVASAIIKNPAIAQSVERWSASSQLHHFYRGAIRFSGISFFVMLAVVAIYLSVVLIGRRHWRGGADGNSMLGHYIVRVLSLVAIAIGVNIFFSNHAWMHADLTSERLNSLSPNTIKILDRIKNNEKLATIKIDAYVSPYVPSAYVETKETLLSLLDEISARSGGKIVVRKHVVEAFSDEAAQAEKTYGIVPVQPTVGRTDARVNSEILLGVAFNCGRDKVVVKFLDRGMPVEYELIRSIKTVAQEERTKIGILKTDVALMGGLVNGRMMPVSELVKELRKQYDLVPVDPSKPIDQKIAALLAVQPSSLSPRAMTNFVEAVKSGLPTAIFEDPYPRMTENIVGTSEPKPATRQMQMFGQAPAPKGDIDQLWSLLGVDLVRHGTAIIWQDYNPYPKAADIPWEWIFIEEGSSNTHTLNQENAITRGLGQFLFPYAGAWKKTGKNGLEMVDLAITNQLTGIIKVSDMRLLESQPGLAEYTDFLETRRQITKKTYNVVVQLKGKLKANALLLGDDSTTDDILDENNPPEEAVKETNLDSNDSEEVEEDTVQETNIHVVLVADVDWLTDAIFVVRKMGNTSEIGIDWNFNNVVLVLNILDSLAGEEDFIAIRRRERSHRKLTLIEKKTKAARDTANKAIKDYREDEKATMKAMIKKLTAKVEAIRDRKDMSAREKQQKANIMMKETEKEIEVESNKLKKKTRKKIKDNQRELALKIRSVQDFYKFCAVLIPPIPPLLVAFFVFFHRRRGEQEGVNRDRLR